MFKQPETLSTQTHAGLLFSPRNDFSFARNAVIAPLAAEELGEASKHYPVAFAIDGPTRLIALLGINGNSTFVEPDGRWCHLPAYRSHFVFAVMEPTGFRRNGAGAFSA